MARGALPPPPPLLLPPLLLLPLLPLLLLPLLLLLLLLRAGGRLVRCVRIVPVGHQHGGEALHDADAAVVEVRGGG